MSVGGSRCDAKRRDTWDTCHALPRFVDCQRNRYHGNHALTTTPYPGGMM